MTQPSNAHHLREDRPQENWLDASQVQEGEDWEVVLPTRKLVSTSLLNPENFIQSGPLIQKLFMRPLRG